jgi:hypothetical protein
VVRQVASAHAVPYHEQPTLLRAIRSHYRMLKHFGRDVGFEKVQDDQANLTKCPESLNATTRFP